ncbi:hypothetical protein T07_10632 [Trichinella nelsoni]|uniref:Uncharacterized protein n=1 Tax=Trichinella nelsoni TaxID=6336 RepID=A0A0V0S762_9BILA|nr:hypothetical protein T07_10632 [Trichinella nelsoni]
MQLRYIAQSMEILCKIFKANAPKAFKYNNKKVVYSSRYTIIEILKRLHLNELYSEMNYVILPAKAVPELNTRF